MSSPISGFAGFNSGLPVDDIILKLLAVERKPIDLMTARKTEITTQKTLYSTAQTKVNDLLVAIKKLTSRNFDGTSVFDSLLGKSSDETVASATATGLASPQTLNLEVKKLPTQTVATSTSGVGEFNTNTDISDLGITAGNFTVFSNNVAYNVVVNAGDDIGDVLNRINAAVPNSQIQSNPTVVNGKITVDYENSANITFGGAGDTSNFLEKTYMLTAIDDGNDTITASQPNTTINLDAAMNTGAANLNTTVTNGTFTINGVSFDTTGKTLNQMMDEINNSAAKVTASFNKGDNTFQLKSTESGSELINLANGSSNFLTAMRLVSGSNTAGSQTAGNHAEFVLNGTTMYATSTTVDSTVTGLTGVTLNLKQAKVGTTVQINIQKDTDSLKTALKDVVEKYNAAISYIDQQTNSENKMPLASETRLKNLRSQLRTLFTSQVSALNGNAYDSLQQVGISTGPIGSSAGKATPKLQLDEAKLSAALAADPDTVEKLFIGQDLTGALDNTAFDDNMEGTFTKVYQLLADQTYTNGSGQTGYGALYAGSSDTNKGLFAAYQSAADKRIETLNKSIQKAEDRLLMKEKTLRQQFLAMDRMIGQYQTQGNALTGLIAQLSANNKQ